MIFQILKINKMNITKKHKLYFRDDKGSIRRIDKMAFSIYGFILNEFFNGDADKRWTKLNEGVTDHKKLRPVQLFVPRTFQNEFKKLQFAISKRQPISRIEISYNGTWRPLCDLQLSKPIVKQESKPDQEIKTE